MVRKFRSVKRVAGGVFGPSKKTLQKIEAGMAKPYGTVITKVLGLANETKMPNTAKETRVFKKKLNENVYSVLDAVNDKRERSVLRISAKYALDAMNITGKKRARVFHILEQMRVHSSLRNGDVAPAFSENITEELGLKKARIFSKLLRSKVRKIKKHL